MAVEQIAGELQLAQQRAVADAHGIPVHPPSKRGREGPVQEPRHPLMGAHDHEGAFPTPLADQLHGMADGGAVGEGGPPEFQDSNAVHGGPSYREAGRPAEPLTPTIEAATMARPKAQTRGDPCPNGTAKS